MTFAKPFLTAKRSLLIRFLLVILFSLGWAPNSLLAQNATEDEALIQRIDAYLREELAASGLPGLSLGLVKGEKTLFLKGYGVADPGGRPMTAQTPMILGSTSKSFTAVAVMQLVEKGQLELETPITKYVPELVFDHPEWGKNITVRHLLHQTSGLTEAQGRSDLALTEDLTMRERVDKYGGLILHSAPGEAFEYSNINYTLLGLLVESVTGKSLNQYIYEHIFAPLNMSSSFTSYEEAKERGIATGYRTWFGRPIPTEQPYLSNDVATGYVISTAEDMTKYVSAHIQAGGTAALLSEKGFAALFEPGLRQSPEVGYGMGWYINMSSGSKWHHGDLAHFHSAMIIVNEEQPWGVVLMANANSSLSLTPMLYKLSSNIADMIKGRPIERAAEDLKGTQQVMNVVLAFFLLASLSQFWFDSVSRRKQKRRFYRILGPIIPKVLLLLAIFMLLPEMAGAPFAVIMLYQPDIGYVMSAIALITVLAAVLHLAASYRKTTDFLQRDGKTKAAAFNIDRLRIERK